MKRGFKAVANNHLKVHESHSKVVKPKRGTQGSAGYDFYLPLAYCTFMPSSRNPSCLINPGERLFIWTDVKAYMFMDEALFIFNRSSMGIKHGLELTNGVIIIDSDYFENENNDGNICIELKNITDHQIILPASDDKGKRTRIAQGVFMPYLLADNDNVKTVRRGGIGSTTQGES